MKNSSLIQLKNILSFILFYFIFNQKEKVVEVNNKHERGEKSIKLKIWRTT
jgi:hypothetical protein